MKRFVRGRSQGAARSTLLSLLLFAGILTLFCLGVNHTSQQAKEEQKVYLEQAIQRCITQCYATEGRYPQSLSYIEEQYGLVYDKDTYRVDYRVVASNLRPQVEVLWKGGNP